MKTHLAVASTLALASILNGQIPKGLSSQDWSSIRKEYERHRHAAFPVEGGHRARNYAQQWTTRFDGRGFEITPDSGVWRWGLELKSYGFAGHERRVARSARATANVERLSYQWDPALEEWFLNDGRGLEHGFTLSRRPNGSGGPLRMRLGVRGGLQPQVSSDGRSASFADHGGRPVLHYAGLKVNDAAGRELAARMRPDNTGLRIEVEEGDATYPLTIDPIAQQAFLIPSNPGSFDWFGHSVAISGDTIVVGAPREDSLSTGVNSTPIDSSDVHNAGAAYVFVRTGGVWTQQAYLKPPSVGTTQIGDEFGWSVGISGDTIVVGAPGEDSDTTGVNSTPNEGSAGADPGAAYVFVRVAGVWSQQAYLKVPNPGTTSRFDRFGTSVAVSGDTVVVGNPGEDSSSTGVNSTPNDGITYTSGAAHVFVRVGGVWSAQAYLKPANVGTSQLSDEFGISVAISGDTIVVGAWKEASSSTGVNSTPNELAGGAGAAYVFVRVGGDWSQQAYLKPAQFVPSGGGQFNDFGFSVSVSGDTVVVGARGEDSSNLGVNSAPDVSPPSIDAGAAYVFVRVAGQWSQQAYLKPASVGTTQAGDFFGQSVAVSGDTIVVGASMEDSQSFGVNSTPNELAAGAGAAYVFERSSGSWTQVAYLKRAAGPLDSWQAHFGYSVAVSGGTIVVGSLQELHNAPTSSTAALGILSGAAYVFTSNIPPTITPAPVSRQVGTSGTAQIATVNDAEDPETALIVAVQSANPSNGVTISLISVDGSGNVTAGVAAAPGATSASFTLRVTDSGGLFAEATLNVTVTQPVLPPTVTPNVSPPANGNGWHMGPVTVSFTVTNADTQSAGCGTTTLNAETPLAGTTLTCSAGNSGGTTEQSVTVRIDLTAPIASGSRTPAANGYGWNNIDVTANFTCFDALSGVVTAASSSLVTTEGAGQSRSSLCQDLAGNTATAVVNAINIDKTAPTGTASRTPLANANGWNNTDVTANFTCVDALSGPVAAGSAQVISTEGAGQSTSFLCQDLAGNSLVLSVMGVNIDETSPAVTPGSVMATPNPAAVNTSISLAANLTDAGSSGLALAEYRIDAGPYSSFGSPSGTSASVSGSLGSFPTPAVLNACVRATDLAGNLSPEECTMIAVYDPAAGFVTGAGVFESPLGALTGSTAAGKALFAFQSRYSPGASVPTGNTQFKFKAGNFEFDSTAYDWLVVAGARAQFKGQGLIKNQAGTFAFVLTAIDGALPGGGGQDKFRLKITGPGGVVYDNQMGAGDSADPSTVIDGGNIVIHK
jgi:hypothetical protein